MVYGEIWPRSSPSTVGGEHFSKELFENLVIQNIYNHSTLNIYIMYLQAHVFNDMQDRSRRGHHYGETW
jgi:hypothetical protein